jgi:glutamate dehydrogenase
MDMSLVITANKSAFFQQISDTISAKFSAQEAKNLQAYADLFFEQYPIHELSKHDINDVIGMIKASYDFLTPFKQKRAKVKVFNPKIEEDGWTSKNTVVMMHYNDVPFIIDSVRMALTNKGLSIKSIKNLMLGTRRDKKGDLLSFSSLDHANAQPDPELNKELLIYIEVNRHRKSQDLTAMAASIRKTITDVNVVNNHYTHIVDSLQDLRESVAVGKSHHANEEVNEANQFIAWLMAKNFTFLGYAFYDINESKAKTKAAKVSLRKSYGLLNKETDIDNYFPTDHSCLCDPKGPLLTFSKSPTRSTIHRRAYPDHITVQAFDENGNFIGVHHIVGLYTSQVYRASVKNIPVIRQKVTSIYQQANLSLRSYSGKVLRQVLETFPRDELFQSSIDELEQTLLEITQINERSIVRLFMRKSADNRFVNVLAYIPRDQFSTNLRENIIETLGSAVGAESSEFYSSYSESILSRTYMIFRLDESQEVTWSESELEEKIQYLARSWTDSLTRHLSIDYDEDEGKRLAESYKNAFPIAYQDSFSVKTALSDIRTISHLNDENPIALCFSQPNENDSKVVHFRVFNYGSPLPLSDVIPVLERMNLKVIGEHPYKINKAEKSIWLHDFLLHTRLDEGVQLGDVRALFEDAFTNIWQRSVENDFFNGLVLSAQLSWRDVGVLRAYAAYMKQITFPFSKHAIIKTLMAYPVLSQKIVELFYLRFDPSMDSQSSKRDYYQLKDAVCEELDTVANLNDDRILRQYIALIEGTVRTNYFQQVDGQYKEYISLKMSPRSIPDIPEPRPLYEIFVFSNRVEGVHLRGGKVARGGLRWSDRTEDFRTEVLGLVKAQSVKNAVIVPNGAKGGFVAKKACMSDGRDAFMKEGIRCYQTFIKGLLDVTDNLEKGKIIPPKNVVRRDEDDAYLVVAADKGTATFSDIANEISVEYGHWLGDAFASGGSVGYDHKAMGITAKGAWVSVQRHFKEKGIDVQKQDFSKSPTRSTIHRRAYPDHITVQAFDENGNFIGVHHIVGLYTSQVYRASVKNIPVIRQKVTSIYQQANLSLRSYSGKVLRQVLETFPRDELFQSSIDELEQTLLEITQINERSIVRLFMRKSADNRFVNVLAYIPRDQFSTNLRENIIETLGSAVGAESSEFYSSYSESILSRTYMIFRLDESQEVTWSESELEEKIQYLARSWTDSLTRHLSIDYDEDEGKRLAESYKNAFPIAYQDSFSVKTALSDIRTISHLNDENPIALCFSQPNENDSKVVHFRVFNYGSPLPLSDVIPVLERMNLKVIGEHPYKINKAEKSIWLHDFLLHTRLDEGVQLGDVRALFEDAFTNIWQRSVENDFFNGLVLSAQLSWRDVGVLRAYAAYMKQITFPFSKHAIIKTLMAYPVLSQKIVELFYLRFDPSMDSQSSKRDYYQLKDAVCEELDTVANLNDDRILRQYIALIEGTVRTNYFQQVDGQYKEYISLKMSPRSIPDIPEPRPLYEIFVFSNRVEGVHLRGGKVARGGLRWSDRTEDFRTEVLGLVKAQSVKNAVIVPNGAKGGFVAKKACMSDGRDAFMKEGIRCYQTFIKGLLDVTDNLEKGKIIPPKNVVRRDEDDAYLVVAADKGTATFSDIANEISVEYGHWLGDAFASGGSVGYDHKAMGITAKGAWVSVQRHFKEKGIDVQKQDFTVVGVGDMAGDVFGNGMLMSKHICLTAAFNHLHIFIDPTPNASVSYKERERLFTTPGTNWADYNQKLISKGGGIFSRDAKSITITPEMQACFDIDANSLTPTDLITALLKSPVDLIWNGGIGTYVKGGNETHADIGDKANDALRINGSQLRCKVFGEGGNLGASQLGRIEFCMNGGACNTDFIDNAAGVDCSDHEVNIKILLNDIISNSSLSQGQRNRLLASMTNTVSDMVLRNNYNQTQSISLSEREALSRVNEYRRLINSLESSGRLNRELEFIPSDQELLDRMADQQSLTRPELSVLNCYVKVQLKEMLAVDEIADNPYLASWVEKAFPEKLVNKYKHHIHSHILRKEIIATQLANDIVNNMGITFCHRLMESTGESAPAVAMAYVVARDVFQFERFKENVEALDYKVPAQDQLVLLSSMISRVRRGTRWFLRNRHSSMDLQKTVDVFKSAVSSAIKETPAVLNEPEQQVWQDKCVISKGGGIFSRDAKSITITPEMQACFDIDANSLTPTDLITALLKSPVDLIWNGGIGTYVKGGNETHADIGDKANDALRINGSQLRCKVFGEGGNLGASQLGRIEFCMNGGACNTDFIDNAAGVDCSDHEVNIKILLNDIISNSSLSQGQRNRLLASMTNTVSDMVLRNNYNQTQSISLSEREALSRVNEYRRLINSLESSGRLNRELEFIPSDQELLDRMADQQSLTRPELSVLNCYVKVQLKEMLAVDEIADNPYLASWVEKAFPEKLVNKYKHHIHSHILRKEIIATQLANDIVNNMGITFCHRLMESTGESAPAVAMAYVVARDVFQFERFKENVEALDYKVPAQDQLVLLSSMISRVRRGTRWFLRNRHSSMDLQKTVDVFKSAVSSAIKETPAVLNEPEQQVWQDKCVHFEGLGLSHDLANVMSMPGHLFSGLGIAEAGLQSKQAIPGVVEMHHLLGDKLGLYWFAHAVTDVKVENYWQAMARESFIDDIDKSLRVMTVALLRLAGNRFGHEETLQLWMHEYPVIVTRWRDIAHELQTTQGSDFAMFSVAMRELTELAEVCQSCDKLACD